MESDIKITAEIIQRVTEMQRDEKIFSYVKVIDLVMDIFMDDENFVDGENIVEGGYSQMLSILRTMSSLKKDLMVINNFGRKEVEK